MESDSEGDAGYWVGAMWGGVRGEIFGVGMVPPLTAWLRPVGQVVRVGIGSTGTSSMTATCRPGSEGGDMEHRH